MKQASIIIASRNRGPQLCLSLPILKSRHYWNVEIILVDDASSDNTNAVLAENEGLLKVHRLERRGTYRKNPAFVLNHAHMLARHDIVIEQGGEVCHLTDCVTPLLELCRPGIVAMARVYNGTHLEMASIMNAINNDSYKYVDDYCPETVQTDGTHWKVKKDTQFGVDIFCGKERPAPFIFCGAIHKQDFDLVGGYDENIPCNNDGDLAERLQNNGVKFVFSGKAIAFHLKHDKT